MNTFPFKFEHDSDDFFEAIGLPGEKTYELIDKTIMYELLAPAMIDQLFNTNEAQGKMTQSSVFERSLARLNESPELYTIFLIAFRDCYKRIKKRITKTSDFRHKMEASNGNISELFKIKANSIEDAVEKMKMVLQLENTIKAIEFLKDSKCDYDKFIDYTVNGKSWHDLIPDDGTKSDEKDDEKYKDIDDLLQNIMSKDDE